MYKFNIEFGDVSGDGHCGTAVFSIECSVDRLELKSLYDKARENTKFNFEEELCDEYGVNSIGIGYLQLLKEINNIDLLSVAEKVYDYTEDETYAFSPKSFLKLFLEFTRMYGGKDFIYKINNMTDDRLSIPMGYGLFSA